MPPTIGADGTVYVGSWDNHLYAIDGESGSSSRPEIVKTEEDMESKDEMADMICGNGMCEEGEVGFCHDDCVDDTPEKKGFFQRILDFIRSLFS